MMMVGYLQVPALDPTFPAALSPAVIGGLVRRDLRYDGLVVTCGLNMRALSDRFTDTGAAVQAVIAGVDILLMSPAWLRRRTPSWPP